jgi:hypothetical protein
MKHFMLQPAFRFVGSVVLLVGTQNVRSQRAVEKIGCVRVGGDCRSETECVVWVCPTPPNVDAGRVIQLEGM